MRYGRFVAVLVFVVAALLMPVAAFAETLSVSQDVRVKAVVAPLQYILIDQQNQIIEIGSNTSQAVEPQVFINKLDPASQISLSKDVYQKYQQLIEGQSLHAGVLYKRSVAITAAVRPSYRIKILDMSSI